MEFVSDYIKEILGFVVISGLVVNILPDNKNVKYVKLFMGLVLTLLLISPILKLGKVDIGQILGSDTDVTVSVSKLEKDINEKLDNEYMRISDEYISELASPFGIEVVRVVLNKDEVSVYVREGSRHEKTIDVRRIVLTEDTKSSKYIEFAEIIAAKFNIEAGKVHIYETG